MNGGGIPESQSGAPKEELSLSPYERKQVYIIYSNALFLNMLINLDHGIIPACTYELKRDLNIDDLFLGMLGSLVFLGLMVGSLSSGVLFTKYSSKTILLSACAMIFVALLLFPLSEGYKIMMGFARFLVGFAQVSSLISNTFITF